MATAADRVPVAKTYKIYIDGKFPRTESGRYFALSDKKGHVIANVCRGSRKDFRNSVVAARKAQPGWAKPPAPICAARFFTGLPRCWKGVATSSSASFNCREPRCAQQRKKSIPRSTG